MPSHSILSLGLIFLAITISFHRTLSESTDTTVPSTSSIPQGKDSVDTDEHVVQSAAHNIVSKSRPEDAKANITNITASGGNNLTSSSENATSKTPVKPLKTEDGVDAVASQNGTEKATVTSSIFSSNWLSWMDNSTTLSILVPIICGVAAGSLIILILCCISCCKRRYRMKRRMRIHKEMNPRNIRKLKAADRIKLLAETSDEEF